MTLLLLLGLIGTILLNIVVNLLSEDMSEWVTSAAEWYVRRYAAKWPAVHRARMTEQCLADLADTRGILHRLTYLVGLWCRVGKLPVETASTADTPQTIVGTYDVPSTNQSIDEPASTWPVWPPPPSTLHVNLDERVSESDATVGENVTVALTGVSATTGVGSLIPSTSGDFPIGLNNIENAVVFRHYQERAWRQAHIAATMNLYNT